MPFVIFTVAQILMKCIASTCIRESNHYIDGVTVMIMLMIVIEVSFLGVFLQSNKKSEEREK